MTYYLKYVNHDLYVHGWGGENGTKPKDFAMTQMNNMQHNEFHQKQIMMMGGVLNTEQKKLSPETIQQMKKDYIKMYYAFTSINWGMGKTLGI